MRKLSIMVLLLLALLLAACSGAQPATPSAETGGEETTTETGGEETTGETGGEETSGTFECSDALGCVTVAPGDPIKLASALVISGENESLGIDSRNGVEIAIEQKGQVLGHDVELVSEDDGCSPEGGQTAAQRITADTQIVAVVGTSCSGAARTAIPLITGAGLTMVSPSNTAPDLTAADRGADFAGYLRTAHNDEFQGRVAAEYAYNELGARTAATIHDGSIYAESLQQVFADTFKELGGEITSQEAINVGDTDMNSTLTRIASSTPDLIYFPVFTAEAAFITSQTRDVDGLTDTLLMSADGSFSIDFVKNAGDAAVGMYFSGPFTAGEEYEKFLAAHLEKYGSAPPSGFHAHAFDATNVLLAAIEKVAVQDADGTLHIGRQALRDAVYATSGFSGLTGALTCNTSGDCATGEALAIFQITDDVASDPDANWPPEPIFQP